ncbi:MAG TPA: carboxypeptidase-like regulatory domain-containing protein [Candidatus Eisenbacteria bacterium]|nr:carboxypeptidase-like regulatory domain-containing protein [Candidatus Eisenbacteria bacterium]
MLAARLGICRSLISILFLLGTVQLSYAATTWRGVLRDAEGKPVPSARIRLQASSGNPTYQTTTGPDGAFAIPGVEPGAYSLEVDAGGRSWKAEKPVLVTDQAAPVVALVISSQRQTVKVNATGAPGESNGAGTGGEHLSSEEVSGLPLNERDFSKLLLLAAGTMTDTNGAANFTQQFATNGQRGVASVFAMDGATTTDPELGGATFANFNVDAIREVQSFSGVMPAEIGQGASGYTNVVTKKGTNYLHGSAFEFLRNAAFDARNFFDHANPLDPRRIPPFVRNEFGVTIGGPVVLPRLYDGRGKTFFFGQYAGFRQVLGTTQVFPVPTADERNGIDTTSVPGDTLYVPVSPEIAPLLARYPLPNLPGGAYGARTYATSSKVQTTTDQFSVRLDHKISDKATLFTRFSFNQIEGPTTNPDQTAIDPSFGVTFFDHQRNAAISYARTFNPNLTSTTWFGYVRSTPIFPAENHTDVALSAADGLYQGFNSADGSIFGSYGNVFQIKHDMAYIHGSHSFKWGGEIRMNRDSTVFATNPNGIYVFGGGTAYSPVFISSASGQHNIQAGDPLPDSLLGLLTATPYEYTILAPYRLTPTGSKFDEAAVRRESYNLYFQDFWKASSRLSINYGLRYELNSRIKEAQNRTSIGTPIGPDGKPTDFLTPGATQEFTFNPQPAYPLDWRGFGPRVTVDYTLTKGTVLHAGGSLMTQLPNLWQDNFLTGGFPFTVQPLVTALPGTPVPFSNTFVPLHVPEPYTTSGELLFPGNSTTQTAANTPIDVPRFQQDLEALTPGDETQLISVSVISRQFRNGYVGTYTAGVDHAFGPVHWNLSYVGTAGIRLPRVFVPNGYSGAGPAFAPYTQFDSTGKAISGYGPEYVMNSDSHSSYNALQTSASASLNRIGLNFAASYTYSNSLDDTSAVVGGSTGGAGTTLQALAQNPLDQGAEKGPSTFDETHVFAVSLFQSLPFDRVSLLQGLSKYLTAGWQLMNITVVTSGPPFTVFSGIQQTEAGAGGTDRPDLVTMPHFSTSRARREDYFGLGENNSSFFSIPIGVPGGTGPNQGVFGTLGRNTFRGPGYQNWDFAIIKDTPFGKRGNSDLGLVEFRAEFFNLFNVVNFGLPANIVRGSGFGIISHTTGNSRQIQFSLKLIF